MLLLDEQVTPASHHRVLLSLSTYLTILIVRSYYVFIKQPTNLREGTY